MTLRRLLVAGAAGLAGYLCGAFGGGLLVSLLSSNTHDRSMEAAMTGAFVLGPLGGLIGFVIGLRRSRAPSSPAAGTPPPA